MTTTLEIWLKQATRTLSRDSAIQVRTEIQEHYQAGWEAAVKNGSTAAEAGRLAVITLGDAKAANRQYRRVLLTSAEAKMLSQATWEARAVCSSPWLKWTMLTLFVVPLIAGTAFFISGESVMARPLLAAGTILGFLFAAPFLPLYTPLRGRAFRIMKWITLSVALGVALQWSWLMTPCLWCLGWIEWTRFSTRQKMPIAKWPKQLYL